MCLNHKASKSIALHSHFGHSHSWALSCHYSLPLYVLLHCASRALSDLCVVRCRGFGRTF
ncbi:hypothetical protein FIBSPDRAFT_862751 [Athelia psychrophila]|uniref:Uncharacterized protein n=1 Tax=Athelia psychrophila TaxID=1759441 RepID=A0A166HXH8_9AGAM|nr:hypothetical protein FIBSPDRAFT_862751 [Fibularhizoctonia sp. CBS 109695]